MSKRKLLKGCRRVVIKVGTSTLTHSNGQLHLRRIESLVREIADLHNQDMEVLLVSSGAIRVGANRMGYKNVPKTMPENKLWQLSARVLYCTSMRNYSLNMAKRWPRY